MKRSLGMALVLGTMAGVAAMQDGAKIALLAQNKEKGVEMRAPKSPVSSPFRNSPRNP